MSFNCDVFNLFLAQLWDRSCLIFFMSEEHTYEPMYTVHVHENNLFGKSRVGL